MPKGVALPSIQHAVPLRTARTDRLLANPPAPTRISRWKCPWAKAQVLFEPVVGGQMQHLMRLSPVSGLSRPGR